MKTKKPVSDKQWKIKFDGLLKLLMALANNPRSGFVELGLRTKEGEALRLLVKAQRRHEWQKVGECWHLFSVHSNPKQSVAYVIQETPRRFTYRIEGRMAIEGYDVSLKKAQAKIEQYFELLTSTS